jgi:branched-chain amino acid transport system substrate-binding protein
MKKLAATVCLSFAIFSGSVASLAAPAVKVAGNLPLTGPIAAWSGQYPVGFKMGIEDSAKKLKFSPEVFQVDFQDNAGKPGTAITVFQRQKMNGFDAYLSGTSEAAIALAPQVQSVNAPHFLIAFDPFLTRQGKNRLRILPNSKIEGPLFVKYALDNKAKRVFVINLNSAYANSEFDSIVEPDLKKAGIDCRHERFEFAAHEFRTIAQKAKAYKPDLVFICGYSTHLRPLVRDLRAAGFTKNGTIMAAMDYVDFLYDNSTKDELKGVAFACPIFEVHGAVKGAEPWRADYKKRYGKLPSYVAAYAYDTAGILGKSYSKFGKVDTDSVRKSLPFDGVTGNINVDKDGDIVATITIAKVAADGKVVEVK